METVLDSIRDHTHLKDGAEVTLEASPTSAQTEKLRFAVRGIAIMIHLHFVSRAFKSAGVNRLSIGVQVGHIYNSTIAVSTML